MQGIPVPYRPSLPVVVAVAILSFAVYAHAGDAAPLRTLPADVQTDVDAIAEP